MASTYRILRPLIFQLPPETAHQLALGALHGGVLPASSYIPPASLQVSVFGLTFKSPIGLAAGFDKNAEVINPILRQGFAFTEAGTVTPLPQPGNPRPRLFRLVQDEAIINRLGFNNKGLAYFTRQFAGRDKGLGIAGANIGKNRNSEDAVQDYVTGLEAVYALADYVTVNISSPNTQGLRDLQKGDALAGLLAALMDTRKKLMDTHNKKLPLLLKIAPDLQDDEMAGMAQMAKYYGVDGLIISNTTVSRPHLQGHHASEQGGLSGKPLFDVSTGILRKMYQLTEGKMPLIGVGGVNSAETAYAKIKAGASLVQLYSALVYQGFGLARAIQQGLAELLAKDGYASISQAIGSDHRH